MSEIIYPIAYGNEEELSLSVVNAAKPDTYSIANRDNTRIILPSGMLRSNTFLTNGARLYWDHDHLEVATAECATLDDLILRIHASEELVTRVVSSGTGGAFRYNRRVLAANGTAWGMHDNIGYDTEQCLTFTRVWE